MRHIISILIENESGALSRVAGLFSARGYNIESLTVAPTEDPSLSRMTILTRGSDEVLEQITKQLNKLIEVVKVIDLNESEHVAREMMLLKVRAAGKDREEMKRMADIFRGRIIDVTESTYVIELTGASSKLDSFIAGLDAGAEDYLTKPFDLPELQARMRALIRRAAGAAAAILECGEVVVDPASKRVTAAGREITLSAREYALLHDLILHKHRVRTRAQLEESLYAWGEEKESNIVEVYIHHLRKKLGAEFIATVRGLGYRVGKPVE